MGRSDSRSRSTTPWAPAVDSSAGLQGAVGGPRIDGQGPTPRLAFLTRQGPYVGLDADRVRLVRMDNRSRHAVKVSASRDSRENFVPSCDQGVTERGGGVQVIRPCQ